MKVLLVGENSGYFRRAKKQLEDQHPDWRVDQVDRLAPALTRAKQQRIDAVVLALRMSDCDGCRSITEILDVNSRLPIVVVGNRDDELAVEAIQLGAQEIVDKSDHTVETLDRAIRFAIERKSAEFKLRQLAAFDDLTGLANRQELYYQLEKACSHSERRGDMFALLLFDLDRFKLVNDIHGHRAGDAVLISVAAKLKERTRAGDTVARLGGDEFAIVLEGIRDAKTAMDWSESLLQRLGNLSRDERINFPVSASIGGAMFPTHGGDVDSILRSADIAMYKVKASGRNGVAFYDEQMDQKFKRDQELESEIVSAIDNREITAWFQPLINIADGSVRGFEALARWTRNGDDPVLPSEFLPIAAKGQLMPSIGNVVRADALASLSDWRREVGQSYSISVNVDADELGDPSFAGAVLDQLDEQGISPKRLVIEVTETTLIERTETTTHNLKRLRNAGCRVALDDFGAGHSSLAYLRQFKFDILKIDRALVSGLGQCDESMTILRAVIELGLELGLEIVAEGVETALQLRMLKSMGCQTAQGYLIARPMSQEAISEWLVGRAARLGDQLEDMTGRFKALEDFELESRGTMGR
ncbi:MAG: EAL domain-containing protein [Pseudomonadota bacterium]